MSALRPDQDSTHDLGTTTARWRNLFVDTITITDSFTTGGSFVFEGATADDHETTLSVVDPTADRTINLPNQSGTLPVLAAVSATAITSTPEELNLLDATAGGSVALATGDALIIGDADDSNNTKKALMSDVITLLESSSGLNAFASRVTISDTTNATSVSDGSLTLTGGLSVATDKDVVLGGDLKLLSDTSILSFGADGEVKLTHVHNSGLTFEAGGVADTNHPIFTFKNTSDDAAGPEIKFVKDQSGANVDNDDLIGRLTFMSDDSGGSQITYGQMSTTVKDRTSSSQEGQISLGVATFQGTLRDALVIKGAAAGGGSADRVDVDLGFGTTSTVTIAGNLTINGTTTTVDTQNLQVKDTNILINDGGSTAGAAGAGLDIEGDGEAVVGFMKVAGDTANLSFKAPTGSTLTLDVNADKTLTVAGDLTVEVGDDGSGNPVTSVINQDLSSDSTAAAFATLTLSASLLPDASGGADIGSATAEFGDIFIGDSKSLKLGEGQDVTLTHDGSTGLDLDSAGGIDIDAGGAIAIDSTAGSITLGAALADGQTLKLGKNGAVETIIAPHGTAGSELYSVINTAGTTDGSDAAGAILLSSVAGGIGLAWADDKDLWAEGGRAVIVANEDAADAIKLHADAGTSQTITLINDAGTAEGAISLTSSAGGVDINAADDKDVAIDGGQVLLTSLHDTANAIYLRANTGTSETIKIHADQGTSESSVQLLSDAGGVDIDAAAAKDVNVAGGQVVLVSKDDAASAISLTANVGSSETIVVTNTQGTADGAIALTATAGGVDIDAAAAKDVNIAGGQVALVSKDNAASAISLTADQGTSETIVVTNTQGTADGAIALTASAGGIALTSAGSVVVDSDAFDITSNQTTDPLVRIVNTTNDANGARLRFVKDKGAAGAADDVAGLIEFFADDANQDQVKFGEIKSQVAVHTNGQEGGKLSLSVASHDGELQPGLILADGDAEDEIDVTIGSGSSSLTTVAGALTVTGNLTVSGTTTTVNSTTLQIDDKNIELAHSPSGSEGDDASVDGGGITLKSSGSDKTITYVNANTAWELSENLVLANGKAFSIDNGVGVPVSVLNATTLGNAVLASSLTSVGELAAGSIAAGFGTIDNGTSNITTGGLLKIDVDGTAVGAVGSLTLGAGGDAGLYVASNDLIVENTTNGKDIEIKVKRATSSASYVLIDASEGESRFRNKITLTQDDDVSDTSKDVIEMVGASAADEVSLNIVTGQVKTSQAGAGINVTKTTGITGDEGSSNAPLFTSNTRAFQAAVTIDSAIADNAHSIGFVVNNNEVSSSSVIMATVTTAVNSGASNILAQGGIEAYAHTLTNGTSFQFSLVNRIGAEIAADSVITINFIVI